MIYYYECECGHKETDVTKLSTNYQEHKCVCGKFMKVSMSSFKNDFVMHGYSYRTAYTKKRLAG